MNRMGLFRCLTIITACVLSIVILASDRTSLWACHGMPGHSWQAFDGHWVSKGSKGRLDIEVENGIAQTMDMMPFVCSSYSSGEVWGYPAVPVGESGSFSKEFTERSGETAQVSGKLDKAASSGRVVVCANGCCLSTRVKRIAVLDVYASSTYGVDSVDVSVTKTEDTHCSWTEDDDPSSVREHREYFGDTAATVEAHCKEGLTLASWSLYYSPGDAPRVILDGLIDSIHANPATIRVKGGLWVTLQPSCSEPYLDIAPGPKNPEKTVLQSLVPDKPLEAIINHSRLTARDRVVKVENLTFTLSGDGKMDGLSGGGPRKGSELFKDPGCTGAGRISAGTLSVSEGGLSFEGIDDTLEPGASTCYILMYTFNKLALGTYGAALTGGGVKASDEGGSPVPAGGPTVRGSAELNLDTDGDAIIDYWETFGYDHEGDGVIDLDLVAMGASPKHKDIFVEVDWMQDAAHSHKPRQSALNAVVKAFKDAPVNNPDGATGITLHIDAGTYGGGTAVAHDDDLNPLWPEFNAIRSAGFSQTRRRFFHYCLFAHDYNARDASGISRDIPSSDFIVSLGSWDDGVGTAKQQAGTFMHELGHNLGFRHGGCDHVRYKPNFLSIMNYFFQMDWLRFNGRDELLDYSKFDLEDLDEARLNEKKGIDNVGGDGDIKKYGTRFFNGSGTAEVDNQAFFNVDWSGNGTFNARVSVDLNNDTHTTVLKGHSNEWQNILFNGGSIGTGMEPAELEPAMEMEELTVEEYRRMKALTMEQAW